MQFDRHQLTEAFNLSVREVSEMHASGLPRFQDNGSGTGIYEAHAVLEWAISHGESRLLDFAGWAEVLTPPPGDALAIIQGVLQGQLPPNLNALEIQAYARAADIFAGAQITEQKRSKSAGEQVDRQVMVRMVEAMYEAASSTINEHLFERLNRTAKAAFDIDDDNNNDVHLMARQELIPILEVMAARLDVVRGM